MLFADVGLQLSGAADAISEDNSMLVQRYLSSTIKKLECWLFFPFIMLLDE
jgi:hypothetical protein